MAKAKNLNASKVKDLLISLAEKLPDNLMADAVNEHGNFSLVFLLKLTDEQLQLLSAECSKQKTDVLFLDFSTKTGNDLPVDLKDYSNFNWNNVEKIEFNGSTCPSVPSHASEPYFYVSVIFIMKDD